MKLKETKYFPGDEELGASGLRSVELECLSDGLAKIRMAYAREWEFKGFFPEYRNGLREKDMEFKQYIINVQCKGEVKPPQQPDKVEKKAEKVKKTALNEEL